MCSAFRTFQGWTALSDMAHDQGVLHTVPIPDAMAYLMLRPLLPDVPDDDMCGVTVSQVFPASHTWHSLLLQALSGIPDVRAGDSVWWHCDMIHSVAPVTAQQGWGNVMYIPAAPWCPRNERYAASRPRRFPRRFQPGRLPRRALRAHLAQPLPAASAQPGRSARARRQLSQAHRARSLTGWPLVAGPANATTGHPRAADHHGRVPAWAEPGCLAAAAPAIHTAWMPQPCRSSCMNGTFTSYAAVLMMPAGQVAHQQQRMIRGARPVPSAGSRAQRDAASELGPRRARS